MISLVILKSKWNKQKKVAFSYLFIFQRIAVMKGYFLEAPQQQASVIIVPYYLLFRKKSDSQISYYKLL